MSQHDTPGDPPAKWSRPLIFDVVSRRGRHRTIDYRSGEWKLELTSPAENVLALKVSMRLVEDAGGRRPHWQ